MEEIRASVAMAVYNGEKYIKEQIDSIMKQLSSQDELIISYDRSNDHTLEIIQEYASQDCRIHIVHNQHPGVQNNFNNAVKSCRGKFIFLSDQDDVWLEGKLAKTLDLFRQNDAVLVIHNADIVDSHLISTGKTIDDIAGNSTNPFSNFVKGTYWGCCMAFRADLIPLVCPFPNTHKVGHDIWIGILASTRGKIIRTSECLLLHRIHGQNVTVSTRKPLEIAKHRLALASLLIKRLIVFTKSANN